MKPSELIELLKPFVDEENTDNELDILFGYDYGDHWHTTVAASITDVLETNVKYSNYHNMNKVVDNEEADEEETTQVILLQ